MIRGYDQRLYILPFDHRESYITGVFHWREPLTVEEVTDIVSSKEVIYEGFKAALADDSSLRTRAGILVDDRFGKAILRDAADQGYITCVSTQRSGQEEFDFEYGEDFAGHIESVNPTFAKVLVRYNPERDPAMNRRQADRLRRLSDYLSRTQRLFMFELLVPPTRAQLERVGGAHPAYDREVRPKLMVATIEPLQEAGVEPDVWKIEGLDRREECERVVDVARRDGRTGVACIILGRGLDAEAVSHWLSVAASVPGFIGFAVGRTTWLEAITEWRAGTIGRAAAVARIAKFFCEWTSIFEHVSVR